MNKYCLYAALACVFLLTSPASANVLCVQSGLNQLGYSAGTVDGAIGSKTRSAATSFATAAGLNGMPELSPATSPEWCKAIKQTIGGTDLADLPSVNGIYPFDLDVTSAPDRLLSQEQLDTFWTMHKTETECLYDAPGRDANVVVPLSLPKLSASAFESTPESLFAEKPANRACLVTEPLTARLGEIPTSPAAPPPFTGFDRATIDHFREEYGAHPNEDIVDFAGLWFASTATRNALQPDVGYDRQLIDSLVAWARAGAFEKNVQQDGGSKGPVVFPIITAMASLANAYGGVATRMTPEERGLVGPWLRSIFQKIASNPEDRQGNHHVVISLVLVLWGLETGDASTVQWSIDNYKRVIHDMRPDGSFVRDSSRGGMGLSYQTVITGTMVLLAATLKSALDLDLFDYTVDGRSIHTAVAYNMAMMKDPITFNKKYALPCPNAGDYYGTVDNPNLDFSIEQTFATSAYLPIYALLNPDQAFSNEILTAFPQPTQKAVFHPVLGAAPLCLFGLNAPGVADIDVASLPLPSDIQLGDVDAATKTVEVMAGTIPEGQLHGLLRTALRGESAGLNLLTYNVDGNYTDDGKRLDGLQMVIDENVGTSTPVGLTKCPSSPQTVTYDNDPHHFAVLHFEQVRDEWRPVDAECIAAALPERQAHAVRYLASSFDVIAKDLVNSRGVDALRSKPLRRLINEIADGSIRLVKLGDEPATTRTVEIEVFSPKTGSEFRSLFKSWVPSGSGDVMIPYNIHGMYSIPAKRLLSLKITFDKSLGTKRPADLAKCGPLVGVESYDADPHLFLSMEFRPTDDVWSLAQAECIANAVPDDQGEMVRFLARSFDAVARDMVSSGAAETIANESLRETIKAIADGRIRFGGAG